MDKTDRRILCVLDENCRTPIAEMARMLRVNRNVVSYRINRMKESGIIQKFLVSVDLGKFGYNTYKIYLRIKENHQLIDFLSSKKEMIHVIRLEGQYNLAAVYAARSIGELHDLLMDLRTRFRNSIIELDVNILVYTNIYKLDKLLLDSGSQPKIERYSHEHMGLVLDETDRILMRAISQEANISYVKLSEKTGFSMDIVKYRMKKLKKICNFRIGYDRSKLGFFHHVILLRTESLTKPIENKLLTWASFRREILYCTKAIGKHDLELNAAITDISDLRRLIHDLQSEFGEMISTYSSLIVSDVLKLDYVPF